MIDKRPRLIARCVDVADVITAVTSAAPGLLVAIRGGRPPVARVLASCNDGWLIDSRI